MQISYKRTEFDTDKWEFVTDRLKVRIYFYVITEWLWILPRYRNTGYSKSLTFPSMAIHWYRD